MSGGTMVARRSAVLLVLADMCLVWACSAGTASDLPGHYGDSDGNHSAQDAWVRDASGNGGTSWDATVRDGSVADAGLRDGSVSDASVKDASVADASVRDGGAHDASVKDAGVDDGVDDVDGGDAGDVHWVEVALVMDSRWLSAFDELSSAKAKAAEIVNAADRMYRRARLQPPVRLTLVDVTAFTTGDPYSVVLGSNGNVASEGAFLDVFEAWSTSHPVEADIRYLLTGYRTNGALGMNNPNSMCTEHAVGFARMARMPNEDDFVTRIASVVAHEIGHMLGLTHDGQTPAVSTLPASYLEYADTSSCSESDFIMSSMNFQATVFSECSKKQLQIAMTLGIPQELGGYNAPVTCLDHAPVDCLAHVDAGCRPGQACCTSRCTLVSAGTGVVCRASKNDTCDVAERCDGQRADCPADAYASSATGCADSTGGTGRCYEGQCRSYAASCAAFNSPVIGDFLPCASMQEREPCGQLYCVGPITGNCVGMLSAEQLPVMVDDGVVCSGDDRCVAHACTPVQ